MNRPPAPHSRFPAVWLAWVSTLFLLPLLLTGCQTVGYYSQAVHGQSQILHRERPIEALLADPSTPPPLQAKLRLVLEIRTFGEQALRLPAKGHYLSYADLGRRFAVWTVHAAPEFSLTPKAWWYPVVGRLEYRGYFSECRARKYAAQLQRQGYDVYVGSVAAYSTLGWFRDPVLNTFINDEEMDLAELLFHELAHQRLFVAGDTEFNEAFATAVAEEGLRRWLESRGDPGATREHEARNHRTEEFVGLVAAARDRLESLYEPTGSHAIPAAEMRLRKQAVLDQLRRDYAGLRQRWGAGTDYERWFAQNLNNAQLNTVDTYYQLVPAFRQMLRARDGDLEAFFADARAVSRLNKKARHVKLAAAALAAPAAEGSGAAPGLDAKP